MENKMEIDYDSTVKKLILLFALEKMEIPLTENSIVDICYGRNNWLKYMDCKEIMYELIEANFIYKIEPNSDDNNAHFTITYEGRNCLDLFYSKIPLQLREKITEFAKENRMHFKRSQEYIGDFSKNDDGSYTVDLKIRSTVVNQPIFQLKIKAPTRQSAIESLKKWRDKAHLVYESVYEMLIEDYNQG